MCDELCKIMEYVIFNEIDFQIRYAEARKVYEKMELNISIA